MYANVKVINKKEHASIKFEPVESMDFARHVSHAAISLSEFPAACRSQPILFANSGEDIIPCVIMGLKYGENLFVGREGKWRLGEYCPLYFKRYPFIYIKNGDKFSLGFDSDFSGVSFESGRAVFDEEGGLTDFAGELVASMDRFQKDSVFTELFCRRLYGLGLFEDMKLSMKFGGNTFSFDGFMVVNELRFNSIPDDIRLEFVKSGIYSFVISHLISLGNFEKLAAYESAAGQF